MLATMTVALLVVAGVSLAKPHDGKDGAKAEPLGDVGTSVSTEGLEAQKAMLNPKANLQPGTKYKAMVCQVARDEAGNGLDQNPARAGNQPKSWSFTVRN